jgi:hypothetical protein
MRRLRVVAVASLLPFATGRAQQLSELAPGARVRIQAPGVVAGRFTGTVLSRTADTLVVASSSSSSARVPISSLTSVEVSRGRSRSRGALKGVAWGAGIGLAIGLVAAGSSSSSDYASGESDSELIVGATGGGAIWGAIIGAIAGSEHWDRYELPRRTSLFVPIRHARPGLGVRIELGR